MITRFVKAVRATIDNFRHGGAAAVNWLVRRTRFDYRKEVGDCLDASVVMAPVQWAQRALPEGQLKVQRRKKGDVDDLPDHPMLALIQTPNPYYGDIVLWWGFVLSMLIDGNAYWMIVRNSFGRPAELWYIPHWMLEPKWPADGSEFISHYRYTPGGGAGQMDIAPEDVIHFRHGINPRNMRKGLSPIDPALREIFSDLEISNFVAALLKNMGVPGMVIAPKGGTMPTPADVEATKSYVQAQFSGDGRGRPLVLGAPTEVSQFGFNPSQMSVNDGRDVAEERVCALIGIPAAVVGFGAGLQQTKVGATMGEMRKQAWENGVIPLGKLAADELKRSLLPQFGRVDGHDVVYDASKVPAMQEDQDKKAERLTKMLDSGAITVYTYRQELGLDADDSHRIYLRKISVIEVPENGVRPEPDPTPKERGAKGRGASQDAYKRGAAYLLILQRQESGLQEAFKKPLVAFFDRLGRGAFEASTELLEAELGKARGAKSDDLIVQTILDRLGIPKWASDLRAIYEAQYLEIAKATGDAADLAGLGASLPDQVAQSIVAAGGRRAGLIDLDRQTRAALFDALAEGRAAGEGAAQLAARILPAVASGPSLDPEVRALRIARTEAKYAQNISTIERGRAAGVTSFIVFDGRLGPGRSLLSHIARDGLIVGIQQAAVMADAEHPNGTLSFAPNFEED
ncbi:MAG: phage portal protein [Sphingopyxis terrae]|nr:phage portal protein [Sphingopyxis terrae]